MARGTFYPRDSGGSIGRMCVSLTPLPRPVRFCHGGFEPGQVGYYLLSDFEYANSDSVFPFADVAVVRGCCSDADCEGLSPFCGSHTAPHCVCVASDAL